MTRAGLVLPLVLSLAAAGGCKRLSGSMASVAEYTRTATERLAADNDAAAAQQQRALGADGPMVRGRGLSLKERYEAREGPDGVFIYDTQTHTTARIGGQTQAGLSLDQAEAAVDALNEQDAKGTRR